MFSVHYLFTLQLEDGNTKLKQMDNLMEELRSWMDDTEKFLSSLAEEKEPARENIIEEKIEVKIVGEKRLIKLSLIKFSNAL